MSHIPLRTCIVCRQKKNKAEMVPITKAKDQSISVGKNIPGRSVYLCSTDCLKKLAEGKRNPVAHLLKINLSLPDIVIELKNHFPAS